MADVKHTPKVGDILRDGDGPQSFVIVEKVGPEGLTVKRWRRCTRYGRQRMSTSIPELAKQLEAARLALDAAKKQMCRLMISDGQATASIQLFGREIALTYLDANTGYQVRCVPGRRALLDAMIAVQREFVTAAASKVEGLEFQLAKAAKALAQGGAS